VGQELGLKFEEKDIADTGIGEELIARGGRKQVPYFVDSERGVEMYESGDIIAYLREHYGPKE
jgi:glutathione S-transferase